MAAAKYLAVILVLQVLGSSLGALVVDTIAHLDTSGFASSDTYFARAADLPEDSFPAGIRETQNAGVWHFSRDENGFGGSIIVQEEMNFSEIEVTYYAPSKLHVYYHDAASGAQVAVPFPASSAEAWTTIKLDAPRNTVSAKSVAFQFVFESSSDYFLLDKLDFKAGPTATEATTEATTPIAGDPSSSTPADNASGAMTPTFITIVAFAILKAFL